MTCQGTEPSAATVPPTILLTAGKDDWERIGKEEEEWERIEGENAREIENIDENGAARCFDLEESFSWPGCLDLNKNWSWPGLLDFEESFS